MTRFYKNNRVWTAQFHDTIVNSVSHQIKGIVGVFGGVAVRIGLGHQVAITVVGEGGDVAQSVHLLGHEATA